MFNNQSLDERIHGNIFSNDGYDYRNERTANRYFMKWSPQEDMKFYSKSRYGSPRMLSKSVPRKNRNLTRCRINRSLNFDTFTKNDLKFKNSSNKSLESICCDDDKQLSRSAKIMKALNFGGSPISIGKKKVNKTLNFDFSPSPKQLLNYNRSPCNIVRLNMSTSSPKIVKSLNFDSSPAESNISSILGTSIDSIDENQNQTPSERRRSVKKSLKYHTSPRKGNFIDNSPILRPELREKIDNIIKISTPNVQTLRNSYKKSPLVKEIFVSTPRNLFNDYDDDDDDTTGPRTPKNRIQLIPESMSAIKKSHKKERFPRLLEADDELAEKLKEDEEIPNDQRPLTPPVEESIKISPFDINSIKRSHKKDKNLKSPLNRLDDESLDGSLFNYSGIDIEDDKNGKQLLENLPTPSKLNYDSDSNSSPSQKNCQISISPDETGPMTPKNSLNLLERITGSSIKKSHKKLKEENRKRIVKSIETSTVRSTTPENVNSSRLLLPNFSSVKKSHKKDKRSKILTNFARRQKIFSYRDKDSTDEERTSPQKRKLSINSDFDDNDDNEFRPLNDSDSIEYDGEINEEFKIFTPIKKMRSAPNRKFTVDEESKNLPLTRCETPILDQSLIDSPTFVTPEKSEIEPSGKSTPKERKSKRGKKVTPKNNKSALNLISNVNSVKKSHKKEKKGNRYSLRSEMGKNFDLESPMKGTDLLNVSNFLTPESSLNSNNTSETNFRNISQMARKFLQNYENDDSKPSTSYEINNERKESKTIITTPPNLFKTKKYLREQQSESIKKSHKKKREELKYSVIVQDLELSDDGSIFTKEDRIDDDDFSTDCAIVMKNPRRNSNNLERTSIILNMNESLFNEKVRTTRSGCLIRNLSNDGSLFDSDEEEH